MKDLLIDRSNNRMRLKSEYNVADSAFSDHSYLENVGRMATDIDKSAVMEESFKRTVTGNRSNSLEGINPTKDRPRKECSRKYNETAIKTRKVDLNGIKEYG